MSHIHSGVYLDYNATTPPSERVQHKLAEWLQAWGNPSSIHWAGRAPKALLREARQQVAAFIGANPLEIIFTSSGTESNNLVLKGVFHERHPTGCAENERRQIIVTAVEHPALLKAAQDLKRLGAEVDVLPVDRDGRVNLDQYRALLSERTLLVSAMLANNETGALFPVKKMAKEAHQVGALFHTDATQALGKMLLSVSDLGVDFATFSGHKFYALRGAGVLFARRGSSLQPQMVGGAQERARRGGTENILAIAALGEMCATPRAELESHIARITQLRDQFEARVSERIPGARVTASGTARVGNTSSVIIPEVEGETLLMSLDLKGFAVSAGSACSSGSSEPSPVLSAMGLTLAEAQSSLRVSLGWNTTASELEQFVDGLHEIVERLRRHEN